MKNAVILHGKPTKERYLNSDIPKPHVNNWFPWIKEKLEERGVPTAVPALPKPYYPVYSVWKSVFEAEQVDKYTALVGHSAGAEFILRWLSENSETNVERVVLVAPYKDFEAKYGDFSEYELDTNITDRLGRLTVISSMDDDTPILRRTDELSQMFPSAHLIELEGFGHFRIGHNMTGPEFPQLLDELAA